MLPARILCSSKFDVPRLGKRQVQTLPQTFCRLRQHDSNLLWNWQTCLGKAAAAAALACGVELLQEDVPRTMPESAGRTALAGFVQPARRTASKSICLYVLNKRIEGSKHCCATQVCCRQLTMTKTCNLLDMSPLESYMICPCALVTPGMLNCRC